MPPAGSRSKVHVGRYDETRAELREVVKATPAGESRLLQSIAAAVVEAVAGIAKADDTVHVSVNASDDGQGNRTYTVTLSHSPAPAPKVAKRPPAVTDG